jgi:hypothetical protein
VNSDEHTEAERERSEARGAELRSELAATDARRAEEETAEAEQAIRDATERKERLSRKEHKAHEQAEQAAAAGADKPEVLIGAAFAGAFIFARVLKRLVD